jgi:hypothetical protein
MIEKVLLLTGELLHYFPVNSLPPTWNCHSLHVMKSWQDIISTSKFIINQSSNLQGAGPTTLARSLFKTAKEVMIILQLQHNAPVNSV